LVNAAPVSSGSPSDFASFPAFSLGERNADTEGLPQSLMATRGPAVGISAAACAGVIPSGSTLASSVRPSGDQRGSSNQKCGLAIASPRRRTWRVEPSHIQRLTWPARSE
jgi:hypothetical protein